MPKNRRSYGGKVDFPVIFKTRLYTCLLKSKREAITIYMNTEQPKIVHQKREIEYVSEYRAYQAKTFVTDISEEEFYERYDMAYELGKKLHAIKEPNATTFKEIEYVSSDLKLDEIEEVDRFKYSGNIVFTDGTLTYSGVAVFVLNRFVEIVQGTITLAAANAFFYGSDKAQVLGYLPISVSKEVFMALAPTSSLPINVNGNKSLKIYEIPSSIV